MVDFEFYSLKESCYKHLCEDFYVAITFQILWVYVNRHKDGPDSKSMF